MDFVYQFHFSILAMSKLLERLRTSHNPNVELEKSKDKQLYTSYAEDLPKEMSYQNVKLANFIELQLIDLESTIVQNQKKKLKNTIKDCLTRSYNIFHEMEKLYRDLGMTFLYSQIKKLISCYGIIFVMLGKEKNEEKVNEAKANEEEKEKQRKSKEINEIQKNFQFQKTKSASMKKLGGIHLFNESYTRYIDYNIEELRQLRKKMNEKNLPPEQLEKLKKQNDRKFRQEVVDELNDNSYLKADGEQISLFLQQKKNWNFNEKHISLGDELEQIATFFKQSQNEALQFLRKSKNQESFHELTQGFNIIVEDYKLAKNAQLSMVKEKMKGYYSLIREKNAELEEEVEKKSEQIEKLKSQLSLKEQNLVDSQTQTFHNFDEEVKRLIKSNVDLESMNEELKKFLKKNLDQEKRQKMELLNQVITKDKAIKTLNEKIEQKEVLVSKLEKKNKQTQESFKTQGSFTDPIKFFYSLGESSKAILIQELKEQGLLLKQNQIIRKNERGGVRQSTLKRLQKSEQKRLKQFYKEFHQKDGQQIDESKIDLKRYSDIFKKNLKKRKSIDNTNKFNETMKNEKKEHFGNQTEVDSNFRDSRDMKTSKKQIIVPKSVLVDQHPSQHQNKIRVFEIREKSQVNYSPPIKSRRQSKDFERVDSEVISKPRVKRKSIILKQSPNQKSFDDRNNLTVPENEKSQHLSFHEEKDDFPQKIDETEVMQKIIREKTPSLSPQRQLKKNTPKRRSSLGMKELSKRTNQFALSKKTIEEKRQQELSDSSRKKIEVEKDDRKCVSYGEEKIYIENIEKKSIFHQFDLWFIFKKMGEENLKAQQNNVNKNEGGGTKAKTLKVNRYSIQNKMQKHSAEEKKEKGKVTSIQKNESKGKKTKKKIQRIQNSIDTKEEKENIPSQKQQRVSYKNNKEYYDEKEQKEYIEKKGNKEEKLNKTVSKTSGYQKVKHGDNLQTKSNNFEGKLKNDVSKRQKTDKSIQQKTKTNETVRKDKSQPKKLVGEFIPKNSSTKNIKKSDQIEEYENISNITPFKVRHEESQFFNDSSFRTSQQRKSEKIELPSENQLEEEAIELAKNCKSIEEFAQCIVSLHKICCGDYCHHLKRYLQNFQRYKSSQQRQTIRMHVEDINQHIIQEDEKLSLPNIHKK